MKIQPRAIYESVMPIFMYEGLPGEIHANEERSEFHWVGYGAFVPAMLVCTLLILYFGSEIGNWKLEIGKNTKM